MPESCQWTPHYRRIMAQIREFPEVHFNQRGPSVRTVMGVGDQVSAFEQGADLFGREPLARLDGRLARHHMQ